MLASKYNNYTIIGSQTVTIVDIEKIKYEDEVPYRYITTTKTDKIPVYGAAAYYIEKCNHQEIGINFVADSKETWKIVFGFTEYNRSQSMVSDFQIWSVAKVRSYADDYFWSPPVIKQYKEEYSYTSYIAGIDEISANGLRHKGTGRRGYYSIGELVDTYQNLSGNQVINLTRIDHYGEYCEYQRCDILQNDSAFYEILGLKHLFQ